MKLIVIMMIMMTIIIIIMFLIDFNVQHLSVFKSVQGIACIIFSVLTKNGKL